ncbi:HlyD family efflux transporter periplasmic adaptor subunit [Sporolituus thermophilus]|uniref:HlyD family secretion protein n=1 Tax=Sporolituus thermophilus DSM 23256 TaxID=1123285 RepID=A0A1G7HFN6_9FIRM|nr:HlyD family efflux transporter periplasmic adaptor subunit [Sporolituus thermophilus]SDE99292.1 HlyD family secretion protein [Sporolituus thermophilus DSM 23256]
MFRRKTAILLLTLLMVAVLGAWSASAGALVDQRSVLSGHVLSVVTPGTAVQEGTVLVVVGTITGPVPAVRATVDGVVKEVMISPGDIIRQGDTVVRIEPSRK